MNETEKMQRLHQLAVKGETLTAEEQTALQNWYETSDREEDSMINRSLENKNSQDLREQLASVAKQIVKISGEVKSLSRRNAALRDENINL